MSDRRLAAIVVAAALLARLLVYAGVSIFGTDAANMLRQAEAFAAGRFADGMGPYHPGFPFLASILEPLLGAERAGFGVSIVLGSAAAAPLFLVARDAVGRPAAFLGALFYAFHPHLVEIQADVMTEGTFLFFLFSAIWLGWETIRDPRWSTAVLAGLSSAAAFLTRAEGLVALAGVPCWIALSLWRGRWPLRLLTLVLVPASAVVLLYPYTRHAKGLSAKQSIKVVQGEEERKPEVETKSGVTRERKPYRELGRHLLKVSYFVFAPLLLLSIPALRRSWPLAVYASFPVVYWLAIAWATSRNPFTSYRYLLPGMALFLPLCAVGLHWAVRRVSWRPWAALAVLAICFVRLVPPMRVEERAFRDAAAWIRTQHSSPKILSSTDKIAYLAGSPQIPVPQDRATFEALLGGVDFVVVLQKDIDQGQPEYAGDLRKRLGNPETFGPVYVFRVR